VRTVLFLVRKEILQVVRDRIMRVQILVPPVVQLLVVAQAMTFSVAKTDLALVDLDRSPASERLVERFTASGRFEASVVTASGDVADRALLTREAGAVLRIPAGFARDLARGRAPEVQLVLNAEDGAAAGIVQGYAGEILAAFSAAEAGAVRPAASGVTASGARGSGIASGIAVQTRTLYNPQGEYLGYMAIGLLSALVTIVGVLLTSQNIAREREIGTLEQLNVTPLARGQFIAGKLIPFWVLGLLELTLGLLIIRWAFGIPFLGSVGWVYLGAGIYLIAALGLGLLISSAAATQQQAMFVTFFSLVTMLFLGGIFTPVESMPGWAQAVSQANPIRHFVDVLRTVLMKGGGLREVWPAYAAMAAFGGAVLPLAVARHRKRAG
jgi:ABC-2 type transport system permease protein